MVSFNDTKGSNGDLLKQTRPLSFALTDLREDLKRSRLKPYKL